MNEDTGWWRVAWKHGAVTYFRNKADAIALQEVFDSRPFLVWVKKIEP